MISIQKSGCETPHKNFATQQDCSNRHGTKCSCNEPANPFATLLLGETLMGVQQASAKARSRTAEGWLEERGRGLWPRAQPVLGDLKLGGLTIWIIGLA
jgi:hypothetical protein